MKKLCVFLILFIACGLISGCGVKEDKVAAENVATSLFEAVRNKDFDKALTFYSPKFFEVTTRDD